MNPYESSSRDTECGVEAPDVVSTDSNTTADEPKPKSWAIITFLIAWNSIPILFMALGWLGYHSFDPKWSSLIYSSTLPAGSLLNAVFPPLQRLIFNCKPIHRKRIRNGMLVVAGFWTLIILIGYAFILLRTNKQRRIPARTTHWTEVLDRAFLTMSSSLMQPLIGESHGRTSKSRCLLRRFERTPQSQ